MNDGLRAQLDEATRELKEHMASWAFAYAHAGGPNSGADHPVHRRTRERTDELQRRVRDLRARVAEHQL